MKQKRTHKSIRVRVFVAGLCLALCMISCAGHRQSSNLAPPPVDRLDTYAETVDHGCAYFYYLWGKSAELDERYDEAIEAYEKALVCDEMADQVMRHLAMLLVHLGRYQQARNWMEQIILLNPADLSARSFLARLYSSMGEVDRAADVYQSILMLDPENLDAMLLLGSLYARNKQYGKAKEVLERLVKLDQDSFVAYLYLAKLYRELKFFDKALEAYETALGLKWSEELALEMADLYAFNKRYEDAIGLYLRILDEDETSEKARALLASSYLNTGEVDNALGQLQILRQYSSDTGKVDFTIGRVLLDNQRHDEAVALFARMYAENPEQEGIRYLYAFSLYKQGDSAQAAELLEVIAPEAREYEDAVMLLVSILRQEEKNELLETLLTARIADEQSRRPRFYMILAGFYHTEDRDAEAREVYEQALVHYPDEVLLIFEYGLFLDRVGDQPSALARMEQVLELDPDNAHALNYVGYTWADSGVNLQEALRYIEQAVAMKPEDGFVRDSLGWVYFKLGDLKRAEEELRKALEMQPDDPTINEHIGDVYQAANQPALAIEAYGKALELYSGEEKQEAVRRKIEALAEPVAP